MVLYDIVLFYLSNTIEIRCKHILICSCTHITVIIVYVHSIPNAMHTISHSMYVCTYVCMYLYVYISGDAPFGIVSLELAGSKAQVTKVLSAWTDTNTKFVCIHSLTHSLTHSTHSLTHLLTYLIYRIQYHIHHAIYHPTLIIIYHHIHVPHYIP